MTQPNPPHGAAHASGTTIRPNRGQLFAKRPLGTSSDESRLRRHSRASSSQDTQEYSQQPLFRNPYFSNSRSGSAHHDESSAQVNHENNRWAGSRLSLGQKSGPKKKQMTYQPLTSPKRSFFMPNHHKIRIAALTCVILVKGQGLRPKIPKMLTAYYIHL